MGRLIMEAPVVVHGHKKVVEGVLVLFTEGPAEARDATEVRVQIESGLVAQALRHEALEGVVGGIG